MCTKLLSISQDCTIAGSEETLGVVVSYMRERLEAARAVGLISCSFSYEFEELCPSRKYSP